jgi:hypothetical protein
MPFKAIPNSMLLLQSLLFQVSGFYKMSPLWGCGEAPASRFNSISLGDGLKPALQTVFPVFERSVRVPV